ncbi:MAG: glycosyltransferase [Clostridia bacterium]
MNQKRCIFHIPNHIDINKKSGSNIRPLKMIEGFKENGYIVDIVMGYAKDRKKQIKQIKQNIKNGVNYDFLYSESSTMPTLLTERHHLPLHPMLDFSFIKYCQKRGIKIGLFYRDMHWMFKPYKKNVVFWKRIPSVLFYKYDLYQYRKLLDYLYLASDQVLQYLPYKNVNNVRYIIDELPPGCDIIPIKEIKKDNEMLNIFYVGGISEDVYNFEKMFKMIKKEKDINFTVCCREPEWEKMKYKLSKYIDDNIKIVHAGNEELKKYYEEADVCSLVFEKNEYMRIAMPIKLFEYLAYNKPIIATKGSVGGKFVENNNIGWTIECKEEEIKKILDYLKNNKEEIENIKNNQKIVVKNNTWSARANKVINDLK